MENIIQGNGGENPTPTTPDTPTVGIGSSEVAGNLKEYQGKYVDIGLDITGNTDTTDDWELFYATDDRIFLIAADYVPVTTLTNWGILGTGTLANNGFTGTNTYEVYWSSPKFLTLPTEETFLSEVMHTNYDLNANNTNDNAMETSQLLNKEAWSVIKSKASTEKQEYIDYVIGGPTLEMWCVAWNKAISGDSDFVTFEADPQPSSYGYKVKTGGTTSQIWAYMDGTQNILSSEKLGKLGTSYKTFFSHTTPYNSCNGYWLASPSTVDSNRLMRIGYDGSVSYNNHDYIYGVRPVVSLKSGVKIVANKGAENKYDVTK